MYKLLTTKTIADLMQDTRGQAHYFVNKYERSLYNRKCTPSTIKFYRNCKETYFDLYLLLNHLHFFETLIDPIHCNSCKYDVNHRLKLESHYKKWASLISKCRDGFRIKNKNVIKKSTTMSG